MKTGSWDFSQRPQRNVVREWLHRCKPLLVVGPSLGAVVRATEGPPRELKHRSAEHQRFMLEVMHVQKQGGRKHYHEFPEGASSIGMKEATAIRGSEENMEVDVGGWRIKEKNMGRVFAATNAEEIAEEVKKAGLRKCRWQEVLRDEDNNKKLVGAAVIVGLAKNLARQGRVSPGG